MTKTTKTDYQIRRDNMAALAAARKAGDWTTVRRLQSDLKKDWAAYHQADPANRESR